MSQETALQRLLQGESMAMLAGVYREELLLEMGLDPQEVGEQVFQPETARFMRRFCRFLGDRHAGDPRVGAALRDWVRVVDDYDAYDTLLTHFEFADKEMVIRQGRMHFPGPLTAHWSA